MQNFDHSTTLKAFNSNTNEDESVFRFEFRVFPAAQELQGQLA